MYVTVYSYICKFYTHYNYLAVIMQCIIKLDTPTMKRESSAASNITIVRNCYIDEEDETAPKFPDSCE